MIKPSKGQTSLAVDWVPDHPDSLYQQLVAKVKAAQQSRPAEIIGMIWPARKNMHYGSWGYIKMGNEFADKLHELLHGNNSAMSDD